MHRNSDQPSSSMVRAGVVYALAAYFFWGFVPIYFKAVSSVPALELLAHRCVWSLLLTACLLLLFGGWRAAINALRDRRVLLTLCASTALIATNWFTFMWAVANDQVLQASLGYYINPLVSVLLGFIFLGERLRRWQQASVVLAGIGVFYLTWQHGALPTVALILAFSFGCYGLLRKIARVGSIAGLALETLLLAPPALAYLVYLGQQGTGSFQAVSLRFDGLLVLAGVVTAVPLLMFTSAARRLRLATLGLLQYSAPTIHLFLAVILYDEPFSQAHLVCFFCIWTALCIYSVDSIRASRIKPRLAEAS